MNLNADTAAAIINDLHLAWSSRDIRRLVDLLAPTFVFRSNLVAEDGKRQIIEGRDAFEKFLQFRGGLTDSVTTVEHFSYMSGIARMQAKYVLRDKASGLQNSGSYRQIAMFRESQVVLLEEFHDVPKIAAFWKLVASEKRTV